MNLNKSLLLVARQNTSLTSYDAQEICVYVHISLMGWCQSKILLHHLYLFLSKLSLNLEECLAVANSCRTVDDECYLGLNVYFIDC